MTEGNTTMGRGKRETYSVSWRLSKPLLERAREEAEKLGISLPTFANMLFMNYFDKKDERESRQG